MCFYSRKNPTGLCLKIKLTYSWKRFSAPISFLIIAFLFVEILSLSVWGFFSGNIYLKRSVKALLGGSGKSSFSGTPALVNNFSMWVLVFTHNFGSSFSPG